MCWGNIPIVDREPTPQEKADMDVVDVVNRLGYMTKAEFEHLKIAVAHERIHRQAMGLNQ